MVSAINIFVYDGGRPRETLSVYEKAQRIKKYQQTLKAALVEYRTKHATAAAATEFGRNQEYVVNESVLL